MSKRYEGLPPWVTMSLEETETSEGRARQAARFERWEQEAADLERLRVSGKNVVEPCAAEDVRGDLLNIH